MESTAGISTLGIVAISSLGILFLIFFIIFIVLMYQKKALLHRSEVNDREKIVQKKLLDASLEIAEQERIKIAANIHDDVGMLLNVLKLNLSKMKKSVDKKEVFDEVMQSSIDIIDNSIDVIRKLANDLKPPTLINLGFIKGMRELCRQINLSDTVETRFISEHEFIEIDKKTELQIYRLIKELLNNTLKHAQPGFIEITAEIKESILIISILHNGMGITNEHIRRQAETTTGLGLKNIFARTQLINGSLDYTIIDNKTARVQLKAPLQ